MLQERSILLHEGQAGFLLQGFPFGIQHGPTLQLEAQYLFTTSQILFLLINILPQYIPQD